MEDEVLEVNSKFLTYTSFNLTSFRHRPHIRTIEAILSMGWVSRYIPTDPTVSNKDIDAKIVHIFMYIVRIKLCTRYFWHFDRVVIFDTDCS